VLTGGLSSTRITIWLLPEDLAQYLSCNASTLLALAIVFEVLSMTVPFMRRARVDYVAHLGGYAMGIIGGVLWRRDHGGYGNSASRWGVNRSKEPRWYEKILGR
jgi:membrane associated rhomboid family serine protease